MNANHHKDTEEGRSLVGGTKPGQPISQSWTTGAGGKRRRCDDEAEEKRERESNQRDITKCEADM